MAECKHQWEEDKTFKGQITVFYDSKGKRIEEIFAICKKCGIARARPIEEVKR